MPSRPQAELGGKQELRRCLVSRASRRRPSEIATAAFSPALIFDKDTLLDAGCLLVAGLDAKRRPREHELPPGLCSAAPQARRRPSVTGGLTGGSGE
jgi:hypothetical protein